MLCFEEYQTRCQIHQDKSFSWTRPRRVLHTPIFKYNRFTVLRGKFSRTERMVFQDFHFKLGKTDYIGYNFSFDYFKNLKPKTSHYWVKIISVTFGILLTWFLKFSEGSPVFFFFYYRLFTYYKYCHYLSFELLLMITVGCKLLHTFIQLFIHSFIYLFTYP